MHQLRRYRARQTLSAEGEKSPALKRGLEVESLIE